MNEDEIRWFVVSTEARREGLAAAHLYGRGLRPFLPTELVHRRAPRGRSEWRARPLFPGYVFVALGLRSGQFRCVLSVPGVRRFLRLGSGYATVDDRAIEALRLQMIAGLDTRVISTGQSRRVPRFRPQQRVVFRDGPFGGLCAVIAAVDPRGRISVLLDLFGRETPVEVGADEIVAA